MARQHRQDLLATCRIAFGDHGSRNGATHKCLAVLRRLDPQTGLTTGNPQSRLHTGVWSPNRGYIQVFGIPSRGHTRVFGVPNGRLCKLPVEPLSLSLLVFVPAILTRHAGLAQSFPWHPTCLPGQAMSLSYVAHCRCCILSEADWDQIQLSQYSSELT